jgi:Asp/Glu/hydantoin racemase
MQYPNRDFGVNLIKARQNHCCYGMGLGIIILDDVYPGFPGDVRNATTYPYNVQFEIVQGVDIQALVFAEDKSPCLEPIRQAALNLEKKGCRAISAECGYFAYFQKEIAASVNVPVFMSSLLQVPWVQQVISPDKVVGIYVGSKKAVRDEHLEAVGITPGSNYVIEGAVDDGVCKEFENLWIEGVRPDRPQAIYAKAEAEFVSVGKEFFSRHPNMGAMVLECTGFPPFARELQRHIDIPVSSYSTLLDYAYSMVVHRDFHGHV